MITLTKLKIKIYSANNIKLLNINLLLPTYHFFEYLKILLICY